MLRKDFCMQRLLVVVDYQNDFIDGALGFAGAEKLAPRIAELIKEFNAREDTVVFTYDTHDNDYLKSNKKDIYIISQTTFSSHKFDELVELIKKKFNNTNIIINTTNINSKSIFQIDFNQLVYDISKYDKVASNIILTGETNIAIPYIVCHIRAVNPIVLAATTVPI